MTVMTEPMYQLTRSWRGCEAVLIDHSVTLVPIDSRQGYRYTAQILPEEMTLQEAHNKAERLNKAQIASGFLDWLWSPVPAGTFLVTLEALKEFDNIVENY